MHSTLTVTVLQAWTNCVSVCHPCRSFKREVIGRTANALHLDSYSLASLDKLCVCVSVCHPCRSFKRTRQNSAKKDQVIQ